jgi:hypothetical protein
MSSFMPFKADAALARVCGWAVEPMASQTASIGACEGLAAIRVTFG